MKKTAVFPGSFDPVTRGHDEIIERALPLFDNIIVAVGCNSDKNYYFNLETRKNFVSENYRNESKISVESYKGLTIDFCREAKAKYMIRGLRNPADFEFEKSIAQTNRKLAPELETVFFLTSTQSSYISSSIVRELLANGGDISSFVSKTVWQIIKKL